MDGISVFISSKQAEFETERAVLADKIRAIPFFTPVIAEEWTPQRTAVRDVFLDKVRSSPIYVGLFHRVYSDATELEYRAAVENPYREVLLYVKDRDAVREPRLTQLLSAARSEHVTFQFEGVKDLLPVFTAHLQAALVRMVATLQRLAKEPPVARSAESALRRRWELERRHLKALGLPNDSASVVERLTDAITALSFAVRK
ncbi:MAG TPA: DUF4062 domain-containing protein [Vicinamibacterales bacterium]|nr:DUF4062 domain-containing protein [Vicinamibacterales bacterium]